MEHPLAQANPGDTGPPGSYMDQFSSGQKFGYAQVRILRGVIAVFPSGRTHTSILSELEPSLIKQSPVTRPE